MLSWYITLYDLAGDNITLKREWLKSNILDVFDHLCIKKVVTDEKNKQIAKMNNKNKRY